jgi:hypothetical protein
VPTALAGCAALVWGYEGIDLKERFPGENRRYLLFIPANSPENPSVWDRISVFVCLSPLDTAEWRCFDDI